MKSALVVLAVLASLYSTSSPAQTVSAPSTPSTSTADNPAPLVVATPNVPVRTFGVKSPNFSLQPFVQFQAWGVESFRRDADVNSAPGLEAIDARTNFFFRRARLGFRGMPYQNVSYTVALFYDNVGADSLAATRNATNPAVSNGRTTDVTRSVAAVGIWDAFLSWKLSATSDLYYLTAGYLRPQISRESLTPAFAVNSFEKSVSQNYIRQSVIGRGFGRATGINLGGMAKFDTWGTRYNVGIFNKNTTGDGLGGNGETQGSAFSPVFVARSEIYFGDAEMDKYGLALQLNYFGKRNGTTVALNGSYQDRTPNYAGNRTIGVDVLANYGRWTLDGEAFVLAYRQVGESAFALAQTGHARVGYSVPLADQTYVEPSFMISYFFGEDKSELRGRDLVYDAGLNWYLDENRYKLYAHYVHQEADGANLGFRNDTRGSYSYGDYAGLGLTMQF